MKRFAKVSMHHFLVILPPHPLCVTYLDEYAVRKLRNEPGARIRRAHGRIDNDVVIGRRGCQICNEVLVGVLDECKR